MTFDIAHDRARGRFETWVEGQHCTLDYDLRDGTMIITHVIVPDAVGGRGIAAALTEAALESARAEHLRVVPQCPYAEHYVGKHPEYSDLLR